MSDQILPQNYTEPRIVIANMCAKFHDDMETLSRPARFHYKQKNIKNKNPKKIQRKIQIKSKNPNTFFTICCQIEGVTSFARASNHE
jgi:late competence protein required for DNA uptake (superfamily II DNA/RNA helicase)